MTQRSLLSAGSNRYLEDSTSSLCVRVALANGFRVVSTLLLVVSGLVFAEFGYAAEELISFDIPAELPAHRGLNLFAEQAGIQIIYPFDAVKDFKVNRVQGEHTLENGLQALIKDSCLQISVRTENSFTLEIDNNNARNWSMKQNKINCSQPGILSALSAAIIAFGAHTPAVAQDAVAPASTTSGKAGHSAFDEVVVTARRREESAQSVPVAVNAFSEEKLEDFRITNMEDLKTIAPSLTVSSASGRANSPVYSLRGVRPTEALYGQDPTVAIYFADAIMSPAKGSNMGMYDLGSIQVLKGPQGTLFGRNTTGGAVLLTPKKPGDQFGGEVSVSYGNDERVETQFGVDLPVVDNFKLRVSGRTVDSDGWQTNVANNHLNGEQLGGHRDRSGRVSADWDISETIENDTILSWDEAHVAGRGHVLQAVNPASFTTPALNTNYYVPLSQTLARAQQRDNTDIESDIKPYADVRTWGVFNTTTFDLGSDMSLKSILGYRDMNAFEATDLDGSAVPRVVSSDQTSTLKHASYELQLLGKALDSRLDWVTGLYYYYEDGFENSPGYNRGLRVLQAADMTNSSYSGFGQGTYHFNDQWSATGGVRLNYDDKEMTIANAVVPTPGGPIRCTMFDDNNTPLPAAGCSIKSDASFNQPTGTVSIEYKPDSDMMFYAASRYGYRAGGFNARANRAAEREPFDQETVLDLELGAKIDWFVSDWQMRSNVAVYQQWYDDIQRTVGVVTGSGLPGSTIQNAAKAEILGFEIDQTIVPTENLTVTLSYVYTDPEYKNWKDPVSGVDLSSTPFPFTPEHAASISAAYTYPLDQAGSLRFVVGANYQDDIWISSLLTSAQIATIPDNILPTAQQSSYWLYDASVSWDEVMGGPVDITAFIKNISDEEYSVGGIQLYQSASVGFNTKVFGDPRTYGLQLRYKF